MSCLFYVVAHLSAKGSAINVVVFQPVAIQTTCLIVYNANLDCLYFWHLISLWVHVLALFPLIFYSSQAALSARLRESGVRLATAAQFI